MCFRRKRGSGTAKRHRAGPPILIFLVINRRQESACHTPGSCNPLELRRGKLNRVISEIKKTEEKGCLGEEPRYKGVSAGKGRLLRPIRVRVDSEADSAEKNEKNLRKRGSTEKAGSSVREITAGRTTNGLTKKIPGSATTLFRAGANSQKRGKCPRAAQILK